MDEKIIREITGIVGKENVNTTLEERKCYSFDARVDGAVPDVIVFPSSAEEVSKILKLANIRKRRLTFAQSCNNIQHMFCANSAKGTFST